MADVVFVHVGPPKTGTTYIQRRLYLNRAALGEHDFQYPVGPHQDMFRAALDLVERPWGGMRPSVTGDWDRLVRRVRRAPGSAVVSHEVLAGATTEEANRAITNLAAGGVELHVVYTARDIARQVSAEWQERLKHRRRVRFDRFLQRIQQPRRSRSSTSFWQVQDLPDVHLRWAKDLDPSRVHLVTVPPPGADPTELWNRFCQAINLNPLWANIDSDQLNPSIGAAESALLRQLNRRLEQAGLSSKDYRDLVRNVIVHETLARRPQMQPIAIPPEAIEWADQVAVSWTRWAEESGINVIGNLADLRPQRRDGDLPWKDPDHPRPADVTSAALDSLVSVILEASRRPAPDNQLLAKTAKLIKGLRK